MLSFIVKIDLFFLFVLFFAIFNAHGKQLKYPGKRVSFSLLSFDGNLLDGVIAEGESGIDDENFMLSEVVIVHDEYFVDEVYDRVEVVELCVFEVLA